MGYLTDFQVRNLKPGKKPYEKMEGKGFGVRILGSEKAPVRTFVLIARYPPSKNPTRRALGTYPDLGLEAARTKAGKWRQLIKAGIDPAVKEEEERKQAALEATRTVAFGSLIESYLEARKAHFSEVWHSEASRYLKRSLTALHELPLVGLTRAHIAGALDTIEAKSGARSADCARTALSSFLTWTIDRGHLELNPAAGMSRRCSNGSRERVLSEAELVTIWQAAGKDDYAAIIRLLILTAQRRDEIGGLEWGEIDLDKAQIDLPGRRTKNRKPHVVPLAGAARSILTSCARLPGRKFVFGYGEKGFQGWSACKRRLEERLPNDMPHWTLHDLRRSVITHLGENGFALPHVTEMLVNHLSGHKAGIAGVYDKAKYLPERRKALQVWSDHMAKRVSEGN